ncbi:MAG: hypothetical protein Fur0021_32370 [Candidatus Promineifilaceae bacterium]
MLCTIHNMVPDAGAGWQMHYALFARAGFTAGTLAELAQANQGLAVILPTLAAQLV